MASNQTRALDGQARAGQASGNLAFGEWRMMRGKKDRELVCLCGKLAFRVWDGGRERGNWPTAILARERQLILSRGALGPAPKGGTEEES